MTKMRLVVVAATLVVVAYASAATPEKPTRATLTTSSTTPLADTPWRYTIVVKDQAGRPLAAKARLQILLGTLVVGCWKGTAMVQCSGARSGTWIAFRGKRTGVLTWPAQSAGVTLTFQATVVTNDGRSLKLRAPVRVKLP